MLPRPRCLPLLPPPQQLLLDPDPGSDLDPDPDPDSDLDPDPGFGHGLDLRPIPRLDREVPLLLYVSELLKKD